eukprot:1161044-Pelagomonas_calceolata.AAC.6
MALTTAKLKYQFLHVDVTASHQHQSYFVLMLTWFSWMSPPDPGMAFRITGSNYRAHVKLAGVCLQS